MEIMIDQALGVEVGGLIGSFKPCKNIWCLSWGQEKTL